MKRKKYSPESGYISFSHHAVLKPEFIIHPAPKNPKPRIKVKEFLVGKVLMLDRS